jgi:ubiquinone/menaquinone biosynthesis C-methylase UbiE
MLSEMKKYENNHFDLVLCRHTLEHLPLDYCLEVLTEMKRVSKFALVTSTNLGRLNKELSMNRLGPKSRSIDLELDPFKNLLKEPVERFYDSKGDAKDQGCHGLLYNFVKEG